MGSFIQEEDDQPWGSQRKCDLNSIYQPQICNIVSLIYVWVHGMMNFTSFASYQVQNRNLILVANVLLRGFNHIIKPENTFSPIFLTWNKEANKPKHHFLKSHVSPFISDLKHTLFTTGSRMGDMGERTMSNQISFTSKCYCTCLLPLSTFVP